MDKVRIFVDSNILVDYFSGRMNDGLAARIMQVGRSGRYELVTSILSAANTVYLRKYFNESFSPAYIEKVVTILPLTLSEWNNALQVPVSDFEDCLQISCAINNGCIRIITRDHDYRNCPLVTMTPREFLDQVEI